LVQGSSTALQVRALLAQAQRVNVDDDRFSVSELDEQLQGTPGRADMAGNRRQDKVGFLLDAGDFARGDIQSSAQLSPCQGSRCGQVGYRLVVEVMVMLLAGGVGLYCGPEGGIAVVVGHHLIPWDVYELFVVVVHGSPKPSTGLSTFPVEVAATVTKTPFNEKLWVILSVPDGCEDLRTVHKPCDMGGNQVILLGVRAHRVVLVLLVRATQHPTLSL
jgi:hypothetical protein